MIKDRYKILVNKENRVPDDLDFKIIEYDSEYPSINKRESLMEEATYLAFSKLKDKMGEMGFHIDLESGYRYREDQEKLFNEILEEKGLEHTLQYVAKPGYSEHETGLAVDICGCVDGKWCNEFAEELSDMYVYLHKIISDYGFILRYPKGKENITGYAYEPWHLRYVNDKEFAKEIMDNNLTLEEATKKDNK